MNSIFFVFGICSSILAATALSYYNAHEISEAFEGSQAVRLTAPFNFDYNWGDYLKVKFYFINLSPGVVYTVYDTDLVQFKEKQVLDSHAGRDVYSIQKQIMNPRILILVELKTSAGWCKNITILDGTAVNLLDYPGHKNYELCLRRYSLHCTIVVDLKNECAGPPSVKIKQNETTMKTTTVKIVDTVKNLKNNTFKSKAPTSPHENTDKIIEKSITSDTNVTNNTAIIIESLSGITLILLAIVAIKKRCWTQHSPLGTPDLLTSHHHEPFYLNMLFRRECGREIAEIDQHIYEEIAPKVSEGG